jgi:hypothetical protein
MHVPVLRSSFALAGDSSTPARYERHETIFRQGDPGNSIFRIQSGLVPTANPICDICDSLPAARNPKMSARLTAALKDSRQIARLSGHTTIRTRRPSVERAFTEPGGIVRRAGSA